MIHHYKEPRTAYALMGLYHLIMLGTGVTTFFPGPPTAIEIVGDRQDVVRISAAILFMLCGVLGLVARLLPRRLRAAPYLEAHAIIFGGIGTLLWAFFSLLVYLNGGPASLEVVWRFTGTAVLSFAVGLHQISYAHQKMRLIRDGTSANSALESAAKRLNYERDQQGLPDA